MVMIVEVAMNVHMVIVLVNVAMDVSMGQNVHLFLFQ